MGTGFLYKVMEMFWNQAVVKVAQHSKCVELYTLT